MLRAGMGGVRAWRHGVGGVAFVQRGLRGDVWQCGSRWADADQRHHL